MTRVPLLESRNSILEEWDTAQIVSLNDLSTTRARITFLWTDACYRMTDLPEGMSVWFYGGGQSWGWYKSAPRTGWEHCIRPNQAATSPCLFKFYPNPAMDAITVTCGGRYRFFDMVGRLVLDTKAVRAGDGLAVDVSGLSSGMYVVSNGRVMKRMVKESRSR